MGATTHIIDTHPFKKSFTAAIKRNMSHMTTVFSKPGMGCNATIQEICKENNWTSITQICSTLVYNIDNIYSEMFESAFSAAEHNPNETYILILDGMNRIPQETQEHAFMTLFDFDVKDKIPKNLCVIILLNGDSISNLNIREGIVSHLCNYGIHDYYRSVTNYVN